MLGTSKSIWDFEPRSVPGCTMWLDGADPAGTGVPPSAGTLTTWIDKSGNGRNCIQYSSLARPTFVTNSLNSKGGVSFTAASSNCYQTQSVLPTPGTIFIVGFSSNDGMVLSGIPTPNSGHPPYYASFARDVEFGVNNTSDTPYSANVGSTSNVNYILTGLYTGSNVTAMMNGGSLSNTITFTGTPKTPVTTLIGINSFGGSLGSALSGTINEFITYSVALTITERQQVEGYLSRKWGITLQNLLVPLTVSNCVLWLDADDSTKFTGGSNWLDKSGTNNHGINGTPGASTMPTVTTWTNGRKAARFVLASKNSMKTTNSIANFASYFMVARIQAAVGYGFLIINNLDGQRQFVMNTTSFPVPLFWAPGGTSINLGSFAQGQGFVFCGTVTSGSGVGHMNGVQVGSNTNPSTSGSSQNYFGSGNGDGGYLTIDIAEIMIYTGVVSSTNRQSIENYLSAKWAIPLSRSGVTLHPFNSIRPFLRRFNPIDIPGCVLWLDAADLSSLTISNGSNLTAIRDKSGVTTPTITSSFLYASNSLNGYGVIYNNNGYIRGTFPTPLPSSIHTTFLVMVATGIPSDGTRAMSFRAPSGLPIRVLDYAFGSFRYLVRNPNTTGQQVTAFTNSYFIWTCYNSSSNLGLRLNGTADLTTNITTNPVTITGYGFGWSDEGDTQINFPGRIAESLVFSNVLTTSQIQQVEGYLAHKWGLTSRLLFTPLMIPGCRLWFDAADSSTITLSSGSNVSSWRDKGITATTATPTIGASGNQITYTTIGGYSGVYINNNGSANYNASTYSQLTIQANFQDTADYSIFAVVNLSNVANGPDFQTIYANARGASGETRTPNFGAGRSLEYNSDNTNRSINGAFIGTGRLQTALISSSSALTAYTNRTVYGSATNGFTRVSTDVGALPSIGGTFGSGNDNRFTTGYFHEIVFYNSALTTTQREQIESYLANKWGLEVSSYNPSTHPFYKFQPSSALPFSPMGISGCKVWLDAADRSTIILSSGTNVSSWIDKSGNGNNGTPVNTPTYSSALNAIACSSGACFSLPNGAFPFSNTSYTYFHVFLPTSGGTLNNLFGGGVGGSTRSTVAVRLGTSSGSNIVQTYWWANGINDLLVSNTYTVNAINIVETWYTSGGTRTITLNFAGSNSDSPAVPGNRLQSNTSNFLGNVSAPGSADGSLNGNHYEFLVYDTALTTAQRQQVESYLAEKWGLKSSLPSTHLYRSFPPSFLGFNSTAISSDGDYSNFLWTRFYNITSDPSINGPGSSGWGSLIGTAGAYNPINYQDGDSRIGQSDFVGVISKGFMYSATQTVVTFRTVSDDGIAVIFNGSTVLQNWTYHGDTTDTSGSVTLPAGYTPIELRFFEWGGGFTCELYWSVGSTGTYTSSGSNIMFHNNTSKS